MLANTNDQKNQPNKSNQTNQSNINICRASFDSDDEAEEDDGSLAQALKTEKRTNLELRLNTTPLGVKDPRLGKVSKDTGVVSGKSESKGLSVFIV